MNRGGSIPRESEHVDLEGFMEGVKRRNPGQTEFIQAVQEVAEDIFEFIADKEQYHRWQILRRIAEPDRVVSFRVCWEDDNHNIRVQRGYRVQNNNAIGPYKGGIRFHPSVNEFDPQVPRLRADLQERADRPADGRRQGRRQFQSQGQERRRDHALLPELHDRALSPYRRRHRRAGRRHRRRRPRDRLYVRPVQAHHQQLRRRADRQGHGIWRLADPHRGDRLWRRLFPREHAEAPRPGPDRQGRGHLRLGQCRHPCRREDRPARRQGADPVRQRGLRPRSRRHHPGEDRLGQGPQDQAPRPHLRICRRI